MFLRGVGKVGGPMRAFLDPLRKSESPESLWHIRGKGQVNDHIVAVVRSVETDYIKKQYGVVRDCLG